MSESSETLMFLKQKSFLRDQISTSKVSYKTQKAQGPYTKTSTRQTLQLKFLFESHVRIHKKLYTLQMLQIITRMLNDTT